MNRYVCLLAASGVLAIAPRVSAATITFSGSAQVQCIGNSPVIDSFSYTNQTNVADAASTSVGCQEIGQDGNLHTFSRGSDLQASLVDAVLHWSGSANGATNQTDAGARVSYVIDDTLTITQTGTFDITMHIGGSGSGSPASECSLYSFTGNVRLNNTSTLLAPVSITPCGTITTDNTFTFFATAGTVIPIITAFSGRVGLGHLDSATFDASNTGMVTITSLDGAFVAESLLTYGNAPAPSPVPEPGTLILMTMGGVIGGRMRSRLARGKR